ncbi:hypothetical protein ACIB24_03185 [Spongisporangium articulatum]|uniref:Uncharacterized protein n=1 Tax=Spongisporangium articulatum TaxID=3362603 RepID=A0ABW8AI69_9ACTN
MITSGQSFGVSGESGVFGLTGLFGVSTSLGVLGVWTSPGVLGVWTSPGVFAVSAAVLVVLACVSVALADGDTVARSLSCDAPAVPATAAPPTPSTAAVPITAQVLRGFLMVCLLRRRAPPSGAV